jgi:hypothetical protein
MANSRSDIVAAVVFVGCVTAILSFFAWRKHQSAWTGVVTGKVNIPEDSEGSQPIYAVVFRTDAGRSVKVRVPSIKDLESYEIGQRFRKKAGQDWPVRVT